MYYTRSLNTADGFLGYSPVQCQRLYRWHLLTQLANIMTQRVEGEENPPMRLRADVRYACAASQR